MQTEVGLRDPDMIPECKCTTAIHYNYVVFHPETKKVGIVGSEYIMRWQGEKMLKGCQGCRKKYSEKSKFYRTC
jgi:hypothetical protein